MLEQLRSRNPKFVLYGLAFVAEIAKEDPSLEGYLFDHKEQMQLWILQFLEHHATNAASPLNMSCAVTLANALSKLR